MGEEEEGGGGKEKEINCYLLIMTDFFCISLNGIYCYLNKNVDPTLALAYL